MRYLKPRKPRGTKLSGVKSIDFCPDCKLPGCDPFGGSPAYRKKLHIRKQMGVCYACGHSPCRCKSSLNVKKPVMVFHGKGESR